MRAGTLDGMDPDDLIATATLTVHDPKSDPFDRGVFLIGCRQVSTLRTEEQPRVHGALEHVRATSTHGWTLSLSTTAIESAYPKGRTPPRVTHVGVVAITAPDGHREIITTMIGKPEEGRPTGTLIGDFGLGAIAADWSTRDMTTQEQCEYPVHVDEQWRRVQRIHSLASEVRPNDLHRFDSMWQMPTALDWFWFPDNETAMPWTYRFSGDVKRAWEYHQCGLDPDEAKAWDEAKIGPHSVAAWSAAGWTPAQAKAFRDSVRVNAPDYPEGAPNSEWMHRDMWAAVAKVSGIAPDNLIAAAQARLSVWELAGTDTEEQWESVSLMSALRQPA